MRIFFRIERAIKTFSEERKQREFVSSLPTLKGWIKEVIKKKRSDKKKESWNIREKERTL